MRCITNIARVERSRGILRRQTGAAMFSIQRLKCGYCRRSIPFWLAWKCFYCGGLWFCARCAAQHFR